MPQESSPRGQIPPQFQPLPSTSSVVPIDLQNSPKNPILRSMFASQISPKTPIPRGRPNSFSPAMIDRICDHVMRGKSLMNLAGCNGFPSETTIYRHLATDPIFREKYSRAREIQADRKFDQAWDIADKAKPEEVAVANLKVSTIKWQVGKMAPKKYGEAKQVELVGAGGGPIQVQSHSIIDPMTLAPELRDAWREILEAAKAQLALNITPREEGE